MRKASIDRPWAAAAQHEVIESRAMPGQSLQVWRTDGRKSPLSVEDKRVIADHPFKTDCIGHMRNYDNSGRSSTFDVAVVPTEPKTSSR